MEVEWVPIDHGTYAAIYSNVHDKVGVYSTHTCTEGCEFHAERYILTEWGFEDAGAPLIRSIDDAGKWTYWIAKVYEERD